MSFPINVVMRMIGGRGGSGFSPDDIDGLLLWMRGDTGLKTGGARQYTASSYEYHSRADNAFFSTGDIDFYVAVWVYADTKPASVMDVTTKWAADPNNEYLIDWLHTTDRLRFVVSNDGTAAVVVSADNLGNIATGTWYFVEAWHDATANTINIQVNRGTANSTAHTTGVVDASASFEVGHIDEASAGSQHWNGRISKLVFAKSAAARAIIDTAALGTFLFNNGNGRVSGEIAAHATLGGYLDGIQMDAFNLNESAGNALSFSGLNDLTDNASVTAADGPATETAQDESSNENHGVLTNMTIDDWSADTPDGTFDPTAKDETSNNNHGTLVGYAADGSDARSTDVATGASGTSMQFDGSNDYVANTTEDFKFTTSFTVSVWVKADTQAAWGRIIDYWRSVGDGGWFIGWNDTNQVYEWRLEEIDNGDGSVVSNTITLGDWYHLVAVYNSDTNSGILYENGLEVDRQTTTGAPSYNAEAYDLGIGARLNPTTTTTDFFDGKIDDIRIYSDALTASEITFLYEDHTGTPSVPGDDPGTANLALHQTFDESNTRVLTDIGAGGSLDFDGTNDTIRVADAAALRPGSGASWSLSSWLKAPDANQSGLIISKRQNGGVFEQYSLSIASHISSGAIGRKLVIGYRQNASYLRAAMTDADFVDGNWHFVAAVLDASADSIALYIDGVSKPYTTDNAGSWPTVDNSDPLHFGDADGGVVQYDGLMDDVQIHSSALTATQIYAMYTGTNVASPVGHWTFDDGPQTPPVDQDPVISWESKEGSKFQFIQATAANRPLARLDENGINHRTILDFDGTNDILVLASAPITDTVGTLTISGETGSSSFSDDQVMFCSSDEGGDIDYLEFGIDSSGKTYIEAQTGGATHRVTGATVLTVSTVYIWTFGSDGDDWFITINGVLETLTVTTSNSGKWFGDLAAPDNMTIGGRKNYSGEDSHFEGKFAEEILYETDLSDADQDRVEGSSGIRYGVTIE